MARIEERNRKKKVERKREREKRVIFYCLLVLFILMLVGFIYFILFYFSCLLRLNFSAFTPTESRTPHHPKNTTTGRRSMWGLDWWPYFTQIWNLYSYFFLFKTISPTHKITVTKQTRFSFFLSFYFPLHIHRHARTHIHMLFFFTYLHCEKKERKERRKFYKLDSFYLAIQYIFTNFKQERSVISEGKRAKSDLLSSLLFYTPILFVLTLEAISNTVLIQSEREKEALSHNCDVCLAFTVFVARS